MNKLIASLTQSSTNIRFTRAANLADRILNSQANLVAGYKARVLDLENQLAEIVDLGPDQTTSLKVAGENFNPGAFVSRIQELRVALRDAKENLAIAYETQREWETTAGPQEAGAPAEPIPQI